MKIWARLLVISLAACAGEPTSPLPEAKKETEIRPKPARIVSLDFCSDQYVLKLADRANILALSPEATQAHSYMREAAKGLATVRPRAEDAIALQPDLIVRAYGGGPNAARFFEQAGIRVLTIGWAGDLDTVKAVTRHVATELGEPERGVALNADIAARLGAITPQTSGKTILYMTPTGVTTGSGSLVHELITAAGLTNYETRPGWHALPLERLTSDQPDLVATSFFDNNALTQDQWSAARHPIARAQLATRPAAALPGAWTACGAWFAMDAVETLANAHIK